MRKPSPAMIVALAAMFVALGGVGVAATGGNFILGQSNTAGNTTALSSGITTGPTLSVTNTGGKEAAKFTANSGVAPFAVGNGIKVANLNADLLDSHDSTYFLPKTGKAANADKLDGIDSTGFVQGHARYRTINASIASNTGLQEFATVGQLQFFENCVDSTLKTASLALQASVAHAAYAGLPSTEGGARFVGSGDMPADVPFGLASASGDPTEGPITVPAIGTAVSAAGEIVHYNLLMINRAGTAGCRIVGSLVQVS
jgi:hypothetical protein